VDDIQAWFDRQGIAIDIAGSFHTALSEMLTGMFDFVITAPGGASSAVGTPVDSIIVLSLAIFMAVDRDGILRLPEQCLEVRPRRRRGWTRIGQLPASPGSSAGRSGDAATMRGVCRDPAEPYDAVGWSGSWPSHLESQRVVQRAISKCVWSGVGQGRGARFRKMCVS